MTSGAGLLQMFAKEVLVVKVMFWSGKAFSPELPGLLSICNES